MSSISYLIGDVFARMAELPDASVDLILTSPPFLALRSYLPADHPDKALEIGSEPDPATFVDTLLRLSAEWRRLLAPHGTLAVELGDTYSGSGGGGGDYLEGGMREGQQQFAGSAASMRESNAAHWRAKNQRGDAGSRRPAAADPGGAHRSLTDVGGGHHMGGAGWPEAKCKAMIPELYRVALGYGIHPLTGQTSPAGRWRVRNVVTWCRPNPPVGALGDKFRPATSDLVVACVSKDRWFDLDAVRTEAIDQRTRTTNGSKMAAGDSAEVMTANYTQRVPSNPAGAPPLDYWVISPSGYEGAHYATFPPELCIKPIEAMCPRRVCRACGVPSERVLELKPSGQNTRKWRDAPQNGAVVSSDVPEVADVTTIGWTSCNCPNTGDLWDDGWVAIYTEVTTALAAMRRKGATKAEKARIAREVLPPLYGRLASMYRGRIDGFHGGDGWRPGVVLDPFAGSGTTLLVAHGHGRDSIGIDLDERNYDLARDRIGPLLFDLA